jgi:Recombination endonuclease VII
MTARNPNARRAACGMTHAEIRAAATETHKHCSQCGKFKPLDDFPKAARGLKGRGAQCRRCWSRYISDRNRRPEVKAVRNAYLKRPHMRRYTRLQLIRRRYGLEAMHLEERRLAGDPCDACGSSVHVGIDHCHNGSGPRGLLCRKCNLAAGFADDDPARLRALAEYLEHHQLVTSQAGG